MRNTNQVRIYNRNECVVFLKTNEPFGGLSNMAGGFPLKVNGLRILTSEALYQACRFPHRPDVQRLIIEQASPMTAKMKSKPYRRDSRPDWDQVRVKIMRWCLRVKLVQNWEKFSKLLLATGNCPIVEQSWKDDFWGAKPVDDQTLVGMNVLGRLLMELREEVHSGGRAAFLRVEPLAIPDFLLLGQPIQPVIAEGIGQNEQDLPVKPTLFTPLDQPPQDVQRATAADLPVQATLFDLLEQAEGTEPQGSAETPRMELAHAPKPYPAYKDSGVEWLGQVPAHWEVRRIRNIVEMRVSNVDKHSKEGEEPVRLCNYVDVYKNDRIRANMEFMKATASAEEIERFRLEHGDVLITKDSEAWDDIGVPALVESTAPDLIIGYHLALLRPKQSVEGAFLLRALQSRPVAYQFHVEAKGVTRYGLSHHAIKSTSVSLPPLPEQTAIVRFLDWADQRIRRVIRARQRRIKLLEEYKQAVIHRAVTGQIDVRTGQRYPAYKDSGVEWLGQVPAHWEVRKLKNCCSRSALYGANVPSTEYSKSGIRFIRTMDITEDGYLKSQGVFLPESLVRDHILGDGDILVSRSGTIGRSFLYSKQLHGPCAYAGYLVRFIPKRTIEPKYLFLFTKTQAFSGFLQVMAIASTIDNVNGEKYANCPFPLPPLAEQTAIVEYLDAQTAKIDAAIAAARREIELLREYRERLIADVVTGKVDVREVAAQLPEEPPEEEAAEDEGIEEVQTTVEDEQRETHDERSDGYEP